MVIHVTGPRGCGKTTVCKAIAKLLDEHRVPIRFVSHNRAEEDRLRKCFREPLPEEWLPLGVTIIDSLEASDEAAVQWAAKPRA